MIALLAGGFAVQIPLATLAAILIVVAWNIAEAPELSRLARRAPREDLLVLCRDSGHHAVLRPDVRDRLRNRGLGRPPDCRRLGELPAAEALLPDDTGRIQQVSPELSDLIQSRPDIAFFTAQGMLSFHSAAAFEYELTDNVKNPLILRMKDVHHVDTSGLLTLEGIIEHRQKHGGRIILTADAARSVSGDWNASASSRS